MKPKNKEIKWVFNNENKNVNIKPENNEINWGFNNENKNEKEYEIKKINFKDIIEIEDNKDKNIIKWEINPNNNKEIREKDISIIKINWGFNNKNDNQDNGKKIEQNLSEQQNPLFQVPKTINYESISSNIKFGLDNNNTTNKEENIQNKDELIKEEKISFGYKQNNNEDKPIS